MYRRVNTILAMVIFIALGCDKSADMVLEENHPKYNNWTIWDCHYQSDWNIDLVRNKIVGVWNWKYTYCCGEATNPHQEATESRGLKIQFNDNGTGVLRKRDARIDFTWAVILEDNDLFGFETVPFISMLGGRLLFCDNIMLCNNSYIDGADNYFEK